MCDTASDQPNYSTGINFLFLLLASPSYSYFVSKGPSWCILPTCFKPPGCNRSVQKSKMAEQVILYYGRDRNSTFDGSEKRPGPRKTCIKTRRMTLFAAPTWIICRAQLHMHSISAVRSRPCRQLNAVNTIPASGSPASQMHVDRLNQNGSHCHFQQVKQTCRKLLIASHTSEFVQKTVTESAILPSRLSNQVKMIFPAQLQAILFFLPFTIAHCKLNSLLSDTRIAMTHMQLPDHYPIFVRNGVLSKVWEFVR